jgi:alkanesulfonate monooxygenase SsuD/methylene tetrahydromethanopterin reductase-like flavin-dependent oxidoreductase (luciferase family)
MEIGIGLPSTIPGACAAQILQWATAAEEHGFSSLGVIDRLVYGNDEPLVTLGAAAAVTQRIKLMTSVLVAPLCTNAALLAKQAATVNHLSNGRLVLGMAVGGYEDDYVASGVPFSERGRRFDQMLDEMTRIWTAASEGATGSIGPAPGLKRSQIVIGGHSSRAYARTATFGAGWIAGSRGVEAFRRGVKGVRQAWVEHGRDGAPRLIALPYFSLGRERGSTPGVSHRSLRGRGTGRRARPSAELRFPGASAGRRRGVVGGVPVRPRSLWPTSLQSAIMARRRWSTR